MAAPIASASAALAPPRRRHRLRWRRRFQFTREGGWYCGVVTLGMGFAAMNTGNNLLYLLLGMLLGLIITSGIMSESSLGALDVKRYIPSRIFAGQSFLMGIALTNRKKRFPSFSVEVEDLLEGRTLQKRCYFLKVPAGRVQQTSYRHRFPRRGLYRLTGFRISTKFPFALFRKSRETDHEADVVILPALVPVGHFDFSEAATFGEEPSHRRGRRGDFMGLRPFQQGDDARSIHWRATARSGRLISRENEDEQRRTIVLSLDNSPPPDAPEDPRDDGAFEQAVSTAASLALHFGGRNFSVGLVSGGVSIPAALGEAHVGQILRTLARLGYADEGAKIPAVPPIARKVVVARGGQAMQAGAP